MYPGYGAPPQAGGYGGNPQYPQYPPNPGFGNPQYPPMGGMMPGMAPGMTAYHKGMPNQYGQAPQATTGGVPAWAAQLMNQIPPHELQVLQQWFQGMDRDHSGTISASELAVLQFGGHDLGLVAAQKLIAVFDKDGNGAIDFKEYAALHRFITKMQEAFHQGDNMRTGFVNASTIHTALSAAGFQLSFPTVAMVAKKYDVTGRGLTFPNFLLASAHLALVRSVFEWNDKMRQGTITLSYDQLAAISVHLA